MENIIRQSVYFNQLNDLDYQAILRCFSARHTFYPKGSVISSIGDEAKYIYIITKGLCKSQYYDINGKLTITRDYRPDEIFGVTYTPDNDQVYIEELVAVEDTYVLRCDLFRFINPCANRCKRHIDCLVHTISKMAEMMNVQTKRIGVLCQSKTRYKILTYLRNQANKKKKYFKIPYNQTELAAYLGLERSALSTELNKLKAEGLIDFDEKLYKIKNYSAK